MRKHFLLAFVEEMGHEYEDLLDGACDNLDEGIACSLTANHKDDKVTDE